MDTHHQALTHDSYLARLANIDATVLEHVTGDGQVCPYATVTGASLIPALVVSTHDLQGAVDRVAAEIMNWGRINAGCRRAWQVREREYRTWKARKEIEYRKAAEKAGDKQPSKDLIEAMYRTEPDYAAVCSRVEASEEALNVSDAIYQAFKTKAAVLKGDTWRAPDGSMQRRSI